MHDSFHPDRTVPKVKQLENLWALRLADSLLDAYLWVTVCTQERGSFPFLLPGMGAPGPSESREADRRGVKSLGIAMIRRASTKCHVHQRSLFG